MFTVAKARAREMSEDEEIQLPYVITVDLGRLPEGDVALRITYATSHERFEARQWDTMTFAMPREAAIELGRALLRQTDPTAPTPPRATWT